MEKKKKKEYAKPQVTKIRLDVKCAVLGFCKIEGGSGPYGGTDCDCPGCCSEPGS